MNTDDSMVLIDTLPPDHFQRTRLPEAQNACVFDVTFLDQVNPLVPSKKSPIVLYGADAHTMDAATAADKLERAGYERITQ